MINNSKDLGKAIKDNRDSIEIEYDYGKKVVKIIGTGKIVWGIAAGAIGTAVTALIITASSGGTTSPATGTYTMIASGTAGAILGPSVAVSATSIAVSGGGMIALKKLRKYKVIKKPDSYLLVKK